MKQRGPLVAALVGVVVILLVIVGLILPKASAVRSKQQEVAKAKQDESALQLQLAQLQADAQDAGKERKLLKSLDAEIPPTADLPGLIRLINAASNQAAVDFMAMSPGQPILAPDGRVSLIPTQITVIGQFFAVDQFLFLLETLPRAAKVLSISVAPGPNGVPELQMDLNVQFYTTDISAGPGSIAGATQAIPTVGATPSPGESGAPATSGPAPSTGTGG
jgi:Tfp pilus assembly protein PilO